MPTYSEELTFPKGGVPQVSMSKFDLFIDGSTATAALIDPTPTNTRPTTRAMSVDNRSALRVMFGGTNAANEVINYQIIAWKWIEISASLGGSAVDAYWPEVIAKGVATLGADVYAATNIGAGTEFIADTITDTIGMPGTSIYSPVDDTRAVMEVPTRGALLITIDTDLDTAAAADVFVQLGELGGLGGLGGGSASFSTPVTETPAPISRTVAAPDTDVPLAATTTYCRWFGIMAKKVGGDNATEIYLYDSTVDNDDMQGIQLDPGDWWETPVISGVQYDLNEFVIDATTAADAVQGLYIPV